MAHAPHEVLGIPASATPREARAAYRRLALIHHPDHNPSDPRASVRFQRILAAYRAFRRRQLKSVPPPAAPRPDRYGCACCGDSFPFPLTCPRCEVPLHDRANGAPPPSSNPRVEAYLRALEALPTEPAPSLLDRIPVPGLLASGSIAIAFLSLQVGPLAPAMLFLGFAAYIMTMELAARRGLGVPSRGK